MQTPTTSARIARRSSARSISHTQPTSMSAPASSLLDSRGLSAIR